MKSKRNGNHTGGPAIWKTQGFFNTLPKRPRTSWLVWQHTKSQNSQYTAKTTENELVGLAAYEISKQYVAVYMPYIETARHSKPTIAGNPSDKRYHGIARMFLAFAVKLSAEAGLQGDVVFEAKTPELAAYSKTSWVRWRCPLGTARNGF